VLAVSGTASADLYNGKPLPPPDEGRKLSFQAEVVSDTYRAKSESADDKGNKKDTKSEKSINTLTLKGRTDDWFASVSLPAVSIDNVVNSTTVAEDGTRKKLTLKHENSGIGDTALRFGRLFHSDWDSILGVEVGFPTGDYKEGGKANLGKGVYTLGSYFGATREYPSGAMLDFLFKYTHVPHGEDLFTVGASPTLKAGKHLRIGIDALATMGDEGTKKFEIGPIGRYTGSKGKWHATGAVRFDVPQDNQRNVPLGYHLYIGVRHNF